MKSNRFLFAIAVLLLVLASTRTVNAILQTFVNYIYWGPSGYTARAGICPGNDIVVNDSGDSEPPIVETADACAEQCTKMRPQCVGFTFASVTKRCTLKSKSCGSTVFNSSNDTSMMFDVYNGTEECPVGFFGWNCSYYCTCNNNEVCNPIDGSCPSGCKDHHWGWGCSLINTCFYDNAGGAFYKGTRYNAVSGAMCQPWHQRQPHKHNLTDADIPDGSLMSARNFCRNPKLSSTGASNAASPSSEPWCYVLDKPDTERETCNVKKCSCEFGRYGTNCEQACPEGRYGQDCRFQCACNADETCSKLTGKCQKCPPGYFGSGCLRRCHCRDSSEVCDYRSGSCTQCAEGFGGVDCYTKLPFLSQQPWVSKRTPHSLTLAWQGWFKCHVTDGCGEGPINGYVIEYHPKNAQISKWIQTVVGANTTEIEFTNLHDDVIYELRVTPIHSVWLQGSVSSPVEFQLCGDPKTSPSDVIFTPNCNEKYCTSEISFKKILNLTDLNCDMSKVTYMVSFAQLEPNSDEKPATYSTVTCSAAPNGEPSGGNTLESCRLSLGRLPPGATFSIKVCASSAKSVPVYWKRLSETMLDKKCGPVYAITVRTPYPEPSPPKNLTLNNVGPRRAFIEWQAPDRPNAPMSSVYYTVVLKEMQVRACHRASPDEAYTTIQLNQTSTYLEPLKPFTEYMVTVFTNNPDGKSKNGAWVQFISLPAAPDAKVNAQVSSVGSDFAQVTIEKPSCAQVHGDVVGYFYEVAAKNNLTASITDGQANDTSFRIAGLEAFTEYALTVRLVNSKGQGVPSEPVKFKTNEAKPAEPRRPLVVNVSANSLEMSIALPQKPRANIRFIEIKLVDLEDFQRSSGGSANLMKKENSDATKKEIIRVAANEKIFSLAQLRSNTKYRIQIRTVADSGVSEWTEPIFIRTRKDNGAFEDAMAAVYDNSDVMNSMPLIAGVVVSILFVVLIFSGVAAFVIMWRRRLSRSMVPPAGSSLSRSCTSGGSTSPSSSTAADDVQGRWRTIPHFLQEMKSEQMMYAGHDVIGMCESPPSTFLPIGSTVIASSSTKQIVVNTSGPGSSTSCSSTASPDSNSSGTTGGLLKKVTGPMPPPRPANMANLPVAKKTQQQPMPKPQQQQQQRPPVAPRPSTSNNNPRRHF